MSVKVWIGGAEWSSAGALIRATGGDERFPLGHLVLQARDGYRWWYATDAYRAVRLRAGEDPGEYSVVVPARAVVAADLQVAPTGVELTVIDDPDQRSTTLSIAGDGGRFETEVPRWSMPDIERGGFPVAPEGWRVRVQADHLRAAIRSASYLPAPIDPEVDKPVRLLLGCDGGALQIVAERPDGLIDEHAVPATGAAFDGVLAFNPALLVDIVDLLDGDVTLVFPQDGALQVIGEEVALSVMPLRSDASQVYDAVVDVIREVFGPGATHPDEDGDLVLKSSGVPVYARYVWQSRPRRLDVLSVLLDGVDATPELLAELNDHNASLAFARLAHSDGQVVARCELVAETLDPGELFTAFQRVADVGTDMAPLLATMFGGSVADGTQDRWRAYLDTVISAEVAPGQVVDLNGADAVDEWPFPGPVQVLTGWNPYNVERPVEVNEDANRRLAMRLAAEGIRFAPATGRAADGGHAEEGFVVWGTTRHDALAIASELDQEAVFELDVDELRLVHCETGREETTARRVGAAPPMV